MLSPLAEGLQGEREVHELGRDAVERWAAIIDELVGEPVTLRKKGALAVARIGDEAEIGELEAKLARWTGTAEESPAKDSYRALDASAVAALEPELAATCRRGLLLATEGQIDNHELMPALARALDRAAERQTVELRLRTPVERIEPYRVDGKTYDHVIDCRGLGARTDLRDLRGVRGELLELHAPEVTLTRPVRILHPRYPIYVVPRGPQRYVVGATCIESESDAPPSVTTTLELLGAVHQLHHGFRYASIVRLVAACRPAFSHNLPELRLQPGLLRVNGLYRHGFLLTPIVTEAAAQVVATAAPLAGPAARLLNQLREAP
jgi:glycine oxidase